jgi:hypothetical protein
MILVPMEATNVEDLLKLLLKLVTWMLFVAAGSTSKPIPAEWDKFLLDPMKTKGNCIYVLCDVSIPTHSSFPNNKC